MHRVMHQVEAPTGRGPYRALSCSLGGGPSINLALMPGQLRPSGRGWPLGGVTLDASRPRCQAQVADDINHSSLCPFALGGVEGSWLLG